MSSASPLLYLLIGTNVLVSWLAFSNQALFERCLFKVDEIKKGQWYRLITSAFIHVNWLHLAFNMLSLYFFLDEVATRLGTLNFLLLYFSSLLAGNALSFLINKSNPNYRAAGASGAVSGVIFAAIALFPGMKLFLLFIPIPLPAWVVGLGFMLYSIYGIKNKRDNIGHEAHFGGALAGVLISIWLMPEILSNNSLTIALIAAPALAFLIVMWVKPKVFDMAFGDGTHNQTIEDKYHAEKAKKQARLNQILEKINQTGSDSLTQEEKDFLKSVK